MINIYTISGALILIVALVTRIYTYNKYKKLYMECRDISVSTNGIIRQLKLKFSNNMKLGISNGNTKEFVRNFIFGGRFSYGDRPLSEIICYILWICCGALISFASINNYYKESLFMAGVGVMLYAVVSLTSTSYLRTHIENEVSEQLDKLIKSVRRNNIVNEEPQNTVTPPEQPAQTQTTEKPADDEALLEFIEELFV